jgi:acyl dehydratase
MSVRQLDHPPKLGRLYARAAVTARGRHGDGLPDITVERADFAIDRNHLASYAEVCGFRHSDVLPATYPHVLAFPLAVTLMVDLSFPFPLPGLVHLGNRIVQHRPLAANERLGLRVHAADLRDHPRGRQFDMITEATVGGELVWSEASTYLRRTSSPAGGGGQGGGRGSLPPLAREGRGGGSEAPTALWRVPRDIGRRYAAVSGDVNPIRLNPLVARVFGFRRAIAHGMWLKARCLAALEGRLPYALTATVEFKSPLLLPSTVSFNARATGASWSFSVGDGHDGRLHLVGQATPASKADVS